MVTFTATTTLSHEEVQNYATFLGYNPEVNKETPDVFVQNHMQSIITKLMLNERIAMMNVEIEQIKQKAYETAVASTDISVVISA